MIEEIRTHWKLWVLAKRPLFRLDWDPIDYQWTNPYTGNKFNFFQYSVQFGRHVLSDTRDVVPTESQYWNEQGITPQFLAKFWAILWARKQPHKRLVNDRRVGSSFDWLRASGRWPRPRGARGRRNGGWWLPSTKFAVHSQL